MSWLVLGLSATALGSVVVTIDKIVVERYRETPWIYAYFMMCFLWLYSALLLLIRCHLGLVDVVAGPATFVALLPGIIHFATALLYTRALLWTDAATAQAVGQLRPVFALLWGFLVFQELFSPFTYGGVALIVVCCILLSIEQQTDTRYGVRFGRSAKYLFLAALLSSLADLSTKWALTDLSFWDTFILNRLGVLPLLILPFLLPDTRRTILAALRQHGTPFLLMIALVEIGAMAALFLTVMAFSRGPLALVSATLAATPLFVQFYTQLLHHLRAPLVPSLQYRVPGALRWLLLVGIASGVYFLSVEG